VYSSSLEAYFDEEYEKIIKKLTLAIFGVILAAFG